MSGKREQCCDGDWLQRAIFSFKVTLIGLLTVLIGVGLILELVGNVEHFSTRVLYTLFIFPYVFYVLYKIHSGVRVIFNRDLNDNRLVTLYSVVDAVSGYFIAGSLVLMLFWVWGQTTFFSNIGSWVTVSPSRVWIRFFLTSVLVGTGVGFGLSVPTHAASELFITLHSLAFYLLNAILIASGLAVVLDNIMSSEKKNGGDSSGGSDRCDVIMRQRQCDDRRESAVNHRDIVLF
jgi:hypothetical protein